MKIFSALLLFFSVLNAHSAMAAPQVLASVHPLALVAASVVPVADLTVLVPPGMTPHDFTLRPSDVDRIQKADVIFWAGAGAEPYLAGFAKRWPDKQWIDVSAWADADEHEHEHEAHAADEHEGHEHHDPHWWLDAELMVVAQQHLAQALGKDPAPFAAAVEQQLQASAQVLAPLHERGFFVFHRAWDHWVEHFGLKQMGAFTLTPEQKPGMKTLQTMRGQLQRGEVVCVFSEPEFSPALVESVVRGLDIQRGELDPMALNIPLTPDGYPAFLRDLTQRFEQCLTPR